jgi:hypothetical protein
LINGIAPVCCQVGAAEIHAHFDPGVSLRYTPGYQYAAPSELKQPGSVINSFIFLNTSN